jgi:hypothetical protein
MEFILDCENKVSALKSMSLAFNCPEEVLQKFLENPEIVKYYIDHDDEILLSFKEYLYEVVVKHFGMPGEMLGAYWFHTTRTLKTTTFASGIKPLGSILNDVWDMLLSAVEDPVIHARLVWMRANGVGDSHFITKTNNSMHWGPFGILVRDVAFHANSLLQHDYLGMPEIIEDICNGYKSKYRESIIEIFNSALTPTIVKFFSASQTGQIYIETSLCYLSSVLECGKPCSASIACFNGNGNQILAHDISKIERVLCF